MSCLSRSEDPFCHSSGCLFTHWISLSVCCWSRAETSLINNVSMDFFFILWTVFCVKFKIIWSRKDGQNIMTKSWSNKLWNNLGYLYCWLHVILTYLWICNLFIAHLLATFQISFINKASEGTVFSPLEAWFGRIERKRLSLVADVTLFSVSLWEEFCLASSDLLTGDRFTSHLFFMSWNRFPGWQRTPPPHTYTHTYLNFYASS